MRFMVIGNQGQAPPIDGTATTSASATTELAGTCGAEAVRRQNGEYLTRLPGLLIHLDLGSGMEAA